VKAPGQPDRALTGEEYYVPGSVLEVAIDNKAPIAQGMPSRADVFFDNDPVFRLKPDAMAKGVKPIAWFDSKEPLRSGWAWGQNYLESGVAAVEASITPLVKQIRTGTIEIKAAALRVLGKAGDAALEQVALITEQAKDPDSIVRAAAISALGSLGPAAAKPNVVLIAGFILIWWARRQPASTAAPQRRAAAR